MWERIKGIWSYPLASKCQRAKVIPLRNHITDSVTGDSSAKVLVGRGPIKATMDTNENMGVEVVQTINVPGTSVDVTPKVAATINGAAAGNNIAAAFHNFIAALMNCRSPCTY